MELRKALAQIEEVHAQVARSEVFNGYRARTVGVTGLFALAAGAAWPLVLPSWQRLELLSGVAREWSGFLCWWMAIGLTCVVFAGADVLGRRVSAKEDRRRQLVVMQFVPVICVGAALWVSFAALDGFLPWFFAAEEGTTYVWMLPGLSAILNGLGIMASRPYLPRAVGFAGLAYIAAGFVLILQQQHSVLPNSWGMGLTFGLGQLFLAFILYLNLERQRG